MSKSMENIFIRKARAIEDNSTGEIPIFKKSLCKFNFLSRGPQSSKERQPAWDTSGPVLGGQGPIICQELCIPFHCPATTWSAQLKAAEGLLQKNV